MTKERTSGRHASPKTCAFTFASKATSIYSSTSANIKISFYINMTPYILAITVAAFIQIATIYFLRANFLGSFLYAIPFVLVSQFLFFVELLQVTKFYCHLVHYYGTNQYPRFSHRLLSVPRAGLFVEYSRYCLYYGRSCTTESQMS